MSPIEHHASVDLVIKKLHWWSRTWDWIKRVFGL